VIESAEASMLERGAPRTVPAHALAARAA
jgi:hypothetical protein